MRSTFVFIACAVAGLSHAQTGAIPPRARPDNSAELAQETAKEAALELPGVLMHGAAVMHRQMGGEGSVQMLNAARKGAGIISYAVDGSRLVGAAARDGGEGLKTEGGQLLLERGIDAVGNAASTIAVRAAVSGGVAATTAAGAAAIAYTGGSVIGGWARDSEWLGEQFGLERTLGHEVDKFYWKITPDVVKEYVSGTRQVDIDSPEFQRDMEIDMARRRRQLSFERIQRENAEQQRLAAQAAGPAPGDAAVNGSPAPEGGPLQAAQFLGQLNDSLRAFQATQARNHPSSPPAAGNTARQCTIDPRTGCHPGHDERSHPGGCKCAR